MLHVLFVSADGLTSVATMPHLYPPMRLVRPMAPRHTAAMTEASDDAWESLQIERREYEYSGRSNTIQGATIHEYVEVY